MVYKIHVILIDPQGFILSSVSVKVVIHREVYDLGPVHSIVPESSKLRRSLIGADGHVVKHVASSDKRDEHDIQGYAPRFEISVADQALSVDEQPVQTVQPRESDAGDEPVKSETCAGIEKQSPRHKIQQVFLLRYAVDYEEQTGCAQESCSLGELHCAVVIDREDSYTQCSGPVYHPAPGLIKNDFVKARESDKRGCDLEYHVRIHLRHQSLQTKDHFAQIVIYECRFRIAVHDPRCDGKIIIRLVYHMRGQQYGNEDHRVYGGRYEPVDFLLILHRLFPLIT